MISDAVNYDDDELELIDQTKNDNNFNPKTWEDESLSNLKKKIKKHYLLKQKNTCPYCRVKNKTDHGRAWDIEHIIPRDHEKNFMFEPKNLCVSCIDCNGRKKAQKVTTSKAEVHLPTNKNSYLIVHPHFDDYDQHILVIKEGLFYIPRRPDDEEIKPKGEKTIEVFGLNRFYKYAEYTGNEDEQLMLLGEALSNAKSEEVKRSIRNKMAQYAIQANLAPIEA